MLGLALLYAVHLLATAVWVSALIGLAWFGATPTTGDWLRVWQQHKRVDLVLWAALAALGATGMFQMSANAQYSGVLQVHSLWAAALLIKHLLVLAVLALTAYHSLHLLPALRRRAWRASRAEAPARPSGQDALARQLRGWLWAQLALAVGVLLLTAVLRATA